MSAWRYFWRRASARWEQPGRWLRRRRSLPSLSRCCTSGRAVRAFVNRSVASPSSKPEPRRSIARSERVHERIGGLFKHSVRRRAGKYYEESSLVLAHERVEALFIRASGSVRSEEHTSEL